MEHQEVQHRAEGGAGSQGGVAGEGGWVEQRRMVMVVGEHQVVRTDLVMEVMMRGVMDNLERGGVRHQLVVGLEVSDLMVNMMDIVMYERLRVGVRVIAMSLKREVG